MQTILELFESSVNKYATNTFLSEKIENKYIDTSYAETLHRVQCLALGLIEIGVQPGDHLSLLSEGRTDWVIAELAILYSGAVNIPLSIKLESSEVKFRINHSNSKFVIISKNQNHKVENIREELLNLQSVIYLDNCEITNKADYLIETLYSKGESILKESSAVLDKIRTSIDGSTPVNITYTSGTTADPKGIILTHRNYTANVEQAYSLMDIPPTYKTLLILPLDHCFAHVAGIYSFMGKGAALAFVQTGDTPMQTLKNIPINIKETKPDLLLSVPALAKNFRKNIEKGVADKGAFTKNLFKFALNTTMYYNAEGHNKGKGLKFMLKPLVRLFDTILFTKIREVFGGRLKFFIGGGALLDIELQRFFYAIGVPMLQGYGLSEATPIISSNAQHKHKLGSSGFIVDNLQLKICDEKGNELPQEEKGEIVIKGENVMKGYYRNEEATKETIKDGWLYTGDLGYVDADGFLNVLGRFKSLLIGNDGEKYSPESIEEALVSKSRFIDQIMLHNNQDPYTVGLIVPNKESIKQLVKERGMDLEDEQTQQRILHLIHEDINHFRRGGKFEGEFPERWLPSAIAVLDNNFNEQNKMMNSTMKIVRNRVYETYKQRIDSLYKSDAKNITHPENIATLKKMSRN
ncbi:MAG: AMP-binding protein [Salinivirgaceae bacterium]|nr:AMP-binding protein [Salinivirgaceae bacterium]MDD4746145.1 AMP-binding protein [Salinivirgaceae bacterium]